MYDLHTLRQTPAPEPVGIRDILEALAENAQREYEERAAQQYQDGMNERQRMIDMDDEFYVRTNEESEEGPVAPEDCTPQNPCSLCTMLDEDDIEVEGPADVRDDPSIYEGLADMFTTLQEPPAPLVTLSDPVVEQHFEIRTTLPGMAGALPDSLQGEFEYVGDALRAIYLEGMRYQEQGLLDWWEVEGYGDHMANNLTIIVVNTQTIVQRTVVL